MKITSWNQTVKFEIDYLNFSSELVFQLRVVEGLEKPRLIAFSRVRIFDDEGAIKTGDNLIVLHPFIEPDYAAADYA